MNTNDVHDSAGRVVAPPQTDLYERPMGPWNDNAAPLRVICAWCADFNPRDPINAHATHGLCGTCADRLRADMDALEATA